MNLLTSERSRQQVLQQEEVVDLANFEAELGISFSKFKKADAQSIEENNALLWAKKIFKTKPNHEVSEVFKDKIRTSEFWGETWTISTLERVMNIKLILFGRETYNAKDTANVLLCGQLNDKILQDAGVFNPVHYIMIEYTGNHYRLIAYKERGTFSFKEIPYDIKIMIVDRCMERSAGAFFLIPDFRQFMTSLKVTIPQEQDYDKEFKEETDELYNSNTVLQIYHQSANGPHPGRGDGEKIDARDLHNFTKLATISEWRRKLSNLWIEPITIDGHTWNSVEHFYQASKFKENNPQFYFAQLLGMSDHISYNLSDAGYQVAKYVPFGPVQEVLPYLLRRADENTSVAGQTSRELGLIIKERARRKQLTA